MIYRILVDHRCHTYSICSDNVVNIRTLRLLAAESDFDIFERLLKLKRKGFTDLKGFEDALANVLGRKSFGKLERETIIRAWQTLSDDQPATGPCRDERDRRLRGASHGWLADVMNDRGLTAPDTKNPRLRYYFTERGWRVVGRHVSAEARRLGHLVKVIRQKNPRASQVAYSDEFQMAILQSRSRSKRVTI